VRLVRSTKGLDNTVVELGAAALPPPDLSGRVPSNVVDVELAVPAAYAASMRSSLDWRGRVLSVATLSLTRGMFTDVNEGPPSP
jgi:hypothetical protein